ncbi:MAG TPA: acetyltransferase [Gammaproteobacteria bacterium]|nr:acetyltransferase [Gammaproteobacteria bacterium]
MYLKHQPTGDLVEVVDTAALFDPFRDSLEGRLHAGEELQEVEVFPKAELVFPSGESLPRCWTDGNYRQGS